ncbi:sensor histidine kinase [Paenibacillus xylaniclasticus]|uniref:sensor histidine kinase n=1 Tax=Paenibacillus xylaniclasticus TaxID=588083 RepID=UPI000FD82FA4|nr:MULTISPECIES: HAMP domain-containing sensor histidine kinase [Paenibacillus]GFN31632.1 two-component sensor histidine kinase [Paenibacillus curdlanolyticus]
MSIRLRLTLWYSGMVAIILLLFGSTLYFYVNYNSNNEVKVRLGESAKQLLEESRGGWSGSIVLNRLTNSTLQSELYVQLYNVPYDNIADKSSNMLQNNLQFPKPAQWNDSDLIHYRTVKTNGNPFMLCEIKLFGLDQQVLYIVQIGAYTGSQAEYLYDLRTILIISSLAAVLIAAATGLLLARKALRPIENVISASRQIEKGSDLSHRIPRLKANDEIGRLIDTLNGMLSKLEKAYNELDEAYHSQRRFVSDASHELRTPLTTIRGNIELLQRMSRPALGDENGTAPAVSEMEAERIAMSQEAMQDIADEAIRMSRLVNDLLSLARADAGFVMEKSEVELLPIIEDVSRRAQHLPRNAEWITHDYSILEGTLVYGNSDYLRQLLFIFIENAFKYTPSGTVDLSVRKLEDRVGIVIKDTGIGMKREEVPNIFDRFYRADESRGKTSGTGLGLSIAKWIIDEHHGFVEVITREEAGSTFTIWLPVSFPQHSESGIME